MVGGGGSVSYTHLDVYKRQERECEAPCSVLKDLIREVENSVGYARNDVRAKAKTWLINHVSSLGEEDVLLAKVHFGYLLPAEWWIAHRNVNEAKRE